MIWTVVTGRIISIWASVPLKWKIYGGLALILAFALFRWRAAGIRAAVAELERKDWENAKRIRAAAEAARIPSPYTSGDVDDGLRDYGHLRDGDQ